MTGPDFVMASLGKPYTLGANGPEAFDCWGLVRSFYLQTRGQELPLHEADSLTKIAKAFAKGESRTGWEQVEQPFEGDVVLMGQARRPHHIGIWISEGVLHAVEGAGVVYSSGTALRVSGWNILGYFRRA